MYLHRIGGGKRARVDDRGGHAYRRLRAVGRSVGRDRDPSAQGRLGRRRDCVVGFAALRDLVRRVDHREEVVAARNAQCPEQIDVCELPRLQRGDRGAPEERTTLRWITVVEGGGGRGRRRGPAVADAGAQAQLSRSEVGEAQRRSGEIARARGRSLLVDQDLHVHEMGPVRAADDLVLHEPERRQGGRNRDEGRVERRVEALGERSRGDLGVRHAVVADVEIVDVVEAQEWAAIPHDVLQKDRFDFERLLQVDDQEMGGEAAGIPRGAAVAVDRQMRRPALVYEYIRSRDTVGRGDVDRRRCGRDLASRGADVVELIDLDHALVAVRPHLDRRIAKGQRAGERNGDLHRRIDRECAARLSLAEQDVDARVVHAVPVRVVERPRLESRGRGRGALIGDGRLERSAQGEGTRIARDLLRIDRAHHQVGQQGAHT